MLSMRSNTLAFLTAWTLFTGPMAFAQKPLGGDKPQPSTSGNGLWDVLKCDLSDFTDKGDKVVANFSSEQEAREYAEQLNKDNKQWTQYTYLAHKRATMPSPVAKDPVLPRERPGGNKSESPSKPNETKKTDNKPPSVAGQKVSGNVGKSKVTMEFKGSGDSGDLNITGDLKETGKWTQKGPGIIAETKKSRFRGKINEDGTIVGIHSTENGSHPSEWRIALNPPMASSASAKITLTGTKWGAGSGWIYTFESEAKLYAKKERLPGHLYSRRQEGNKLYTKGEGDSEERESTITDDEIKGYLKLKRLR